MICLASFFLPCHVLSLRIPPFCAVCCRKNDLCSVLQKERSKTNHGQYLVMSSPSIFLPFVLPIRKGRRGRSERGRVGGREERRRVEKKRGREHLPCFPSSFLSLLSFFLPSLRPSLSPSFPSFNLPTSSPSPRLSQPSP